jgi:hypothetical protein
VSAEDRRSGGCQARTRRHQGKRGLSRNT